MSYALKFTERALQDLSRLDPWLQEEVLDELELLTVNPPAPKRRLAGAAVHDFVRHRPAGKFYVFITVIPDPAATTLRVSEIGSYVSPV